MSNGTNGNGGAMGSEEIKTDIITLTRFLNEEQTKHKEATGDFTLLCHALQFSFKSIAYYIRRASLINLGGLAGSSNTTGDDQKKLDVIGNDLFIAAMKSSGRVRVLVSEEEDEAIIYDDYPGARYAVACDPIDGSSNLDAGVSVGTIFGIHKLAEGAKGTKEDLLKPGTELVAAGFTMYGASTQLVLTMKDGPVNGFTMDNSLGEFILTHPDMQMPKKRAIYSCNEGNSKYWEAPVLEWVDSLKQAEKPYSARYIGSMVADAYRTLLYGGIFAYPADKKSPKGKLRILHLLYTIPPALALSLLYFPLSSKLDLYKVLFLVSIAVLSTIPWDSYLIRTNIWSYPPSAVLGLTLFHIPLEEVFFFVVQTYNTSLLYLLLSKPILHSCYLVKEERGTRTATTWRYIKIAGQLLLALTIKKATDFIRAEGPLTYLGLILVWAVPFLLLLWSLAYQFLLSLPLTSTLVPIVLPTLYLWVVDTLALRRGTWVISAATKTGWEVWSGLEMEEAIFFLLTNMLIVCGLVAFDNAMAVLNTFPAHYHHVSALPSPIMLIRALLLPASTYDDDRIVGLKQCVERLRSKSRSFYLASSTFQGRLRIDLIILYSFCRVADDLIDTAATATEAREWVAKLKTFLDLSYGAAESKPNGSLVQPRDRNQGAATLFAMREFPQEAQMTLLLLPTQYLGKEPLYELLRGFDMDLTFNAPPHGAEGPIKTEADLTLYSARVAGTVALSCIQLVLHHYGHPGAAPSQRLLAAGHDMGVALQYINIARDLGVDARLGRCYLPPAWLQQEQLTPASFLAGLLKHSDNSRAAVDDAVAAVIFAKKVAALRARLLDHAFALYAANVAAIERLPPPARGGMRVAVESYVQIGRELRRRQQDGKPDGKPDAPGALASKATVPAWKRVAVVWRALLGPR
nr:bifunctional lycopene cyclase/phytoene synthase [Quercus suber]